MVQINWTMLIIIWTIFFKTISIHALPCTFINQGKVCGQYLQSREGRRYSSFKGIPYAVPPVGDLRFRNPEPAEKWTETFVANKDAPSCMQKNYLLADPFVEGQEDCLYLNVYIPSTALENRSVRPKYPVMVYIHGGGFFSGAGNSSLHGPEYFMDEDVILVTFNYRLGIFGFLSTSDDVAPGNWAFRDMILALQWVQENIKYFGGLADNVTIFGQSAGAASVHYLILSPITKSLFHKGIMQSGSALNLFATPINSIDVAKYQALFVNCPSNSSTIELVDCLRTVDADVLIESGDKFKIWSVDPLNIFLPSVEKTSEINPHPFLPDTPLNLIKKGEYNHVPTIIGVVENEGIIRAAPISTHSALRNDLNAHWDELGPQLFATAQSTLNNLSNSPILWNNMTQFYMKGKKSIKKDDPHSIQGFIDMYSDRGFVYGVYQSAVKHLKTNTKPIYFYKFGYAGRDSWSTIFEGHSDTHLAFTFNKSHCDDLNYLFRIRDFFPDALPENSPDTDLSKKMVKMWTNFAREGIPAKFWKELSHHEFNYLEISGPKNIKMESNLFDARMEFWNNQDILENR